VLSNILYHAAASSNYFGDVIAWDQNIERVSRKITVLCFVIFLKSLAKLFDSFLDIFECALHRTNALVRLQNSVVVIFVATHVNSQFVLQVFGEVAMLSDNETASVSVNYKFCGKLHIFLDANSFWLDFFPVFYLVGLFFNYVEH